eukprot:152070-Chlamydomonas_euryale.AAC.1
MDWVHCMLRLPLKTERQRKSLVLCAGVHTLERCDFASGLHSTTSMSKQISRLLPVAFFPHYLAHTHSTHAQNALVGSASEQSQSQSQSDRERSRRPHKAEPATAGRPQLYSYIYSARAPCCQLQPLGFSAESTAWQGKRPPARGPSAGRTASGHVHEGFLLRGGLAAVCKRSSAERISAVPINPGTLIRLSGQPEGLKAARQQAGFYPPLPRRACCAAAATHWGLLLGGAQPG